MSVQIVVPALGESVTEATVSKWMKKVGDAVKADEPLLELETDKVTQEVYAPSAGTLGAINADTGAVVPIGAVLGVISEGGAAAAPAAPVANRSSTTASPETPGPAPIAQKAAPEPATPPAPPAPVQAAAPAANDDRNGPAVRKMTAEAGINPAEVSGTGKDGRVTKADVIDFKANKPAAAAAPAARPAAPAPAEPHVPRPLAEREERVPMSRLRRRIAERLKQAQNNAAMLTTFNEVDMGGVMGLREKYKDGFEKRHKVKLGFMGFFVKACIQALKEIPAVNGEIDGNDIIFKNHYDIGVAVGTEQGLVVPVVRDADKMSIAEIEAKIAELGRRAREGKLSIDELTGGTFTISNGGVYGSLMSTPILNPPQSGILGMHKIQQRPMAVDGKVEIRPMMYLAMSYDHRIIDGREAVTFLVRVKECLEDPQRLLLEL
jgi:2-oxoglutarate dehydrogenase E2 component (dihydrolipoamide succinyltransferase)